MRKPVVLAGALLLAVGAFLLGRGFARHCPHCRTCCRERAMPYQNFYDLNQCGMRIGYVPNCRSGNCAQRIYNHAELVPFGDVDEMTKALLLGRLDAVVYDDFPLRSEDYQYPGRFVLVPGSIEASESVVAVRAGLTNLVAEINAFVEGYKKSGAYDRMLDRWIYDPDPDKKPPAPPEEGDRELVVGTDAQEAPNTFHDDNNVLDGFDIDFMCTFARANGYRLRFVIRPYEELKADLKAGRIDAIVDNLDDAETIPGAVFSKGYADTDIRVMVMDKE